MAAKSKQSIELSGSTDELFKKAHHTASALFRIKTTNEELDTIEAKTGFSLWSWSEKINTVSECALPTQLIDGGKTNAMSKSSSGIYIKINRWNLSLLN